MIKTKPLIFLTLLLFSCSGLEFVYDGTNQKNNILSSVTKTVVLGDENILLKKSLERFIGEASDPHKYYLTVTSEKKFNNLVVKNSQIATQIENVFTINYILKNKGGLCIIDEKKITTSLDYKVKSSGYNFGSDLSKKNIIRKNIKKNISLYMSHIINKVDETKCTNDNSS